MSKVVLNRRLTPVLENPNPTQRKIRMSYEEKSECVAGGNPDV